MIWSFANLKYSFYWLSSVWNMSNVWNISTVWKQKNSNEKLKVNLMELRLYKFMKQYFFKPSFINKNDKRFLALLSRHYVYESTNKLSSGSQQRPKPRTWMYRYGPKFIICMIMPGMSNRLNRDPIVCCDWFSILNPNVIKPCITGQANHGEHEYIQYVLSFLNRFRLIKIWYYLGSLHVNMLKIQQRKFWPKIGKHQIEHLTV